MEFVDLNHAEVAGTNLEGTELGDASLRGVELEDAENVAPTVKRDWLDQLLPSG
jgi:uncharacterized protein YjbI with pentapeptide repeats